MSKEKTITISLEFAKDVSSSLSHLIQENNSYIMNTNNPQKYRDMASFLGKRYKDQKDALDEQINSLRSKSQTLKF